MQGVVPAKDDRHWIVCQAMISSGVLTDSLNLWGNQVAFPPATLLSFMAAYVPLSVSGMSNPVGSCRVHEIECQFFGVPVLPRPALTLTQMGPATLTAAGALTIPATVALAGLVPVPPVTTGTSNASISGESGPIFADHCDCDDDLIPLTLTTVWPAYGLVGGVVPAPLPVSLLGTFTGLVLSSGVPVDSVVRVSLSLYKTRLSNGLWREDDITAVVGRNLDYLDHFEDVVIIPSNFTVYQSRGWRLRLPFPLSLSKGEGLAITVSQVAAPGFQFIVPFIRTRVTEIA